MTEKTTSAPPPDVSFVIPVVERRGNLRQLFTEYSHQVQQLGRHAEFIFVIDHRQRDVVPELEQLQESVETEVILIILGGKFGESTSLTVGLQQARGEVVVTLASYFQVDPSGLGEALDLLSKGVDLVVGRRYPRTDSLFNRLQTRIFHSIVNWMTGTDFQDISCGFRVMKAEVCQEINIYGGLHRFIPILALRAGFRVEELPLAQRAEDRPTRYRSAALYLKRLLDILTVFFLLKFTTRPLRFFGLLGMILLLVGGGITGYLGVFRILGMGSIGDRPLLLLGVLLVVLGIQTLSIGLIGEIIIFTHARGMRHYRIAEIIRKTGDAGSSSDVGPQTREQRAP
jgi:glycosyltransferase involved in cell wall biosynthesis